MRFRQLVQEVRQLLAAGKHAIVKRYYEEGVVKLKLKLLVLGMFLTSLAMRPSPALAACQYTEYANVLSEGACISICRYYGCSNYEYTGDVCYCEVPAWMGTGIPL